MGQIPTCGHVAMIMWDFAHKNVQLRFEIWVQIGTLVNDGSKQVWPLMGGGG